MSLSDRIRPNSEAAPWVIAEVAKLEGELAELREQNALQLAACDCAAMLDTPATHEGNKTVVRDNPAWSPAFDSVMRRTAECIELRRWKAEMLEVERQWDCQKLAALLGATLGDKCRAVIQEKVPLLLAAHARLHGVLLKLVQTQESAALDYTEEDWIEARRALSGLPPRQPESKATDQTFRKGSS